MPDRSIADNTAAIERAVSHESKPRLKHLFALWSYTFRATKLVSFVYLGLTIAAALLRPALAVVWSRYVGALQESSLRDSLIPAALMLTAYFAIDFIASLMDRYCYGGEYIEKLDIVQTNRIQEYMQTKMFAKLSALSPEYFEVASINDKIAQTFHFITSQSDDGVSGQVMRSGFQIIGKLVSVIGIASTLYVFNPALCLILLFAPLPGVWFMLTGGKLQFKFRKQRAETQRRMRYFQDLMTSASAKEIITLGLHGFIYGKWKRLADDFTKLEQKHTRHSALLQSVDTVISSAAISAGCVLAVMLMAAGRITLGALAAVIQLTNTLSNDVMHLLRAVTSFISKKNEAAQWSDLASLPESSSGNAADRSDVIACENLRYRYPLTDAYVLDGVTLAIREGEKVALVGENGAGKTTFVKLITGMLSPSSGEMREPGIDALGAVMQDPARYTTFTSGDNVFFGDVAKPRDERAIDAALSFAGFEAADKGAFLGKDSGGVDLSGGQWQKLAIARAAYRNRSLIILDEPTGNLDPLAEAEVFKKYVALAEDKTVLFVTHRISAAALADRIIVFKGGKVVEDGTHGELLQKDGEYARLYLEQGKWYAQGEAV
ncbi:MAG: ABC transporter ATP-binding protein/permease [Oscillospiraceae bacterium]|nr:ABC transporter ATP-binding protein/permease [Oscillospiraceae bacterium]